MAIARQVSILDQGANGQTATAQSNSSAAEGTAAATASNLPTSTSPSGANPAAGNNVGATATAAASVTDPPTSTTFPGANLTATNIITPTATGTSPKSEGVAIGSVVGGTIGGFALGLAAGLLLMLIWLRHKRKHTSRGKRYTAPTTKSEKDARSKVSELGGTASNVSELGGTNCDAPATSWLVHLPQPSDDSALCRQARTLFQQIDLHVENFYSNTDVRTLSETADAAVLHYDSHLLPSSITTQLEASINRKAIIKHCLAFLITSKIDPSNATAQSLLPAEIATLPVLLAQSSSAERRLPRVYNEAYSQWRVLTAYLRPSKSPLTSQQEHDILALAEHFSNAFAPWATPASSTTSSNSTTRIANLQHILRQAIEVGVLFFAQPSRLVLRWSAPPTAAPVAGMKTRGGSLSGEGSLQVETAPALLKVSDACGKTLARPLVLAEATVTGRGQY